MSIEEQNIDVLATEQGHAGGHKGPHGHVALDEGTVGHSDRSHNARAYGRIALWGCLLLALAIRVWLVARTNGVIGGDEVLVGVQAEHILRGALPIYFYGQPYMGSLEAYLEALFVAIGGPSAWTLRAEPVLLSLVVVCLTWKLAAAPADPAQLPPYSSLPLIPVPALFVP